MILCILSLHTVDALYERFHKRTVGPMSVYIVLCAMVLTGLLILHRVLDPRESSREVEVKMEEEKTLLDN